MGNVKQVEYLLLEGVEVGLEGLQDGAVVEQVVTGEPVGDRQDAGGGEGGAAAVFGVKGQLAQVGGGHGTADLALDEGLDEHGDEVAAQQPFDAGGVLEEYWN